MPSLPRPSLVPILALSAVILLSACGQESGSPDAPGASAAVGNLSPDVLLESPPGDLILLDVRSEEEFAAGHVPGARNIPHTELADRLEELAGAEDRPVVVYCERGPRAGRAADLLVASGYTDVRRLEGHMSAWRAAGRPIETPSPMRPPDSEE